MHERNNSIPVVKLCAIIDLICSYKMTCTVKSNWQGQKLKIEKKYEVRKCKEILISRAKIICTNDNQLNCIKKLKKCSTLNCDSFICIFSEISDKKVWILIYNSHSWEKQKLFLFTIYRVETGNTAMLTVYKRVTYVWH